MARAERILRPQRLSADAFAPYGDVIAPESAVETIEINQGYATRFHDLTEIVARDGRAGVSLFRARPPPKPIRVEMMERHPLGSQAFVPLSRKPFVVVVAPAGDLDPDRVVAFTAGDGQGVNYAPGTWHHFLVTLEPQDFLVIDRIGEGANCDEVKLSSEQTWVVEL